MMQFYQFVDMQDGDRVMRRVRLPQRCKALRKGDPMKSFEVVLRGVTPLMQSKWNQEELLAMHRKDKKKFVAPLELRDAAAAKVYVTADKKKPMVPAEVLMACLIGAGKYIKLDGKRQMSTAKSTMLPGFLRLEASHFLLETHDGKEAPWEVDIRPGRNPNGDQGVAIVRPRFDEWQLRVPVSIDVEQIPEKTIRELFDYAGSRCGLQEFRPERKGIYGQFVVVQWGETKKKRSRSAA